MRASALLLAVGVLLLWGCASSAPPPRTVAPAIVSSGESRFTVVEQSAEPARTFDEVLKWNSHWATLRPVFALLHQGINWLLEYDHKAAAAPHVRDVSARSVVAEALARTLQASGRFGRYVGIKRRTIDADSETAWRDVMNVALARTMHDLATDPELIAAIARIATAQLPR